MKTFDDVLTDFVLDKTQPLSVELAKDDWSIDTGDKKLAILAELENEIAKGAVELVKAMLENEIDGVNILELFFKREMISVEVETLLGFRAMLDSLPDIQEAPFNYDWLTERIRGRLRMITEQNNLLAKFTEGAVTVEEL